MKKLYKDPSNKMICGVCSGIANYLNVDPTIIRLVWTLTIIFAGFGILAYFVCALVIPEGPVYDSNEQYWQQQQQQYNQNGQPYYNSDPNQQYNNQGTYYDPNQNNNNNG